jgi:SAM-dependent methyltransferase
VHQGVIRFLAQDDVFYEGAYDNQTRFTPRSERLWHVWPLWLINSGYLWMVRRYVPADSTVVELGCAGGVCYFGNRYKMIGCDLSFSSLKKLDTIYDLNLQSNASECIPLPDCSVDAVISSYFWEHIIPSVKPNILAELKRILRPGGKLIFLYDVETENPLISRFKKKDIALYKRLFIDGDGHLGYQTPDENITIFFEADFRLLEHQGMEKTWLQSTSAYTKLAQFDNNRLFAWASRLALPPFFYIYTALLRVTDTLICRFLPKDWARMDLVVCKKEDS